jgi:hypothetical protein
MYFGLHELIRPSQQFRSDDHDRGSAIPDFLVLLFCEVDKYSPSRMFDGEKGKNGRAVVGDRYFL